MCSTPGPPEYFDDFQRELYHRRLNELTLFGGMSEPASHDQAVRYASGFGLAMSPAPAEAQDRFRFTLR